MNERERWFRGFLIAYIVMIAFRHSLFLPFVEAKLQPTELVFIALAPVGLLVLGRKIWPGWSWFTCGLMLYLGVLTVSALTTWELGTSLEALGRWYLLVFFLLVVGYVRIRGRVGAEDILWAWTACTVIIFATAYIGYFSALMGQMSRFVVVYENYPYFGTVYRAASTAGGPTPIAVIGILPLIWHYRRWRTGKGGLWWLFLLLSVPILFLTFAKEVVLLGLGCFLVDPFVRGKRWLAWTATVGIALFYWGVTHYLVEAPHVYQASELEGVVFNSGNVVYRNENIQLTETSYVSIKRACFSLGLDYPLIGIGPDQLEHMISGKNTEGIYPPHLPDYTPHSTWFGALAEVGLLGSLGVIVLVLGAWRTVARGLKRGDDVDLALFGFCVAFFIGAMAMDLLHLRFVWVGLGTLVGYDYFNRKEEVKNGNALALSKEK